MADLAYPVSSTNLGHLLMAQHCTLCLNACFSPPTAPQPPPSTTPLPPARLTPKDSIRDKTAIEKTTSKTRSVQIACRISYEILAI